jgi:ribonuclease HII
MDEVGRGALAGPVTVGAVAVRLDTPTAPKGLHDSKLLTPDQRERLVPRIRRWAPAWGVGHASNDEIDRWGILCALRVAGLRALEDLGERAAAHVTAEQVILDGSYDWLRRPPLPGSVTPRVAQPGSVHLMVRADRRCAAVAAASVLAKVDRDRFMVALGREDDRFGWVDNKGYAAPEHRAALREHGPGRWHRRSWNLLGVLPGADGGRDGDGHGLEGQDVLMADADLLPEGYLQGASP